MHIGLLLKCKRCLYDCVLKNSWRRQKDRKVCEQLLINRNASGTEYKIQTNTLVRKKLCWADKLQMHVKSEAVCCDVQVAGALQTPQIPVAVRWGAGSAAEQPAGEPAGLPHHHTRRESGASHELHRQRAGTPPPPPQTTGFTPSVHEHKAVTCCSANHLRENVFQENAINVFTLSEFLQRKKERGHLHPVSETQTFVRAADCEENVWFQPWCVQGWKHVWNQNRVLEKDLIHYIITHVNKISQYLKWND